MGAKSEAEGLSLVELLPDELGDADVRTRLRKFETELDELLVIDQASQVAVDRKTVKRALQDARSFPPELRDRIDGELETRLGPKLKERGKDRSLPWRDGSRHSKHAKPMTGTELRNLGVHASASVDDTRRILRERFPEIPGFWLEADATAVREKTVEALTTNQSVWDCCLRHLGWWGALWVFAAVGAALIVGTATGPWGTALAVWLIGVLGGGTAAIVFNCLLNPSF